MMNRTYNALIARGFDSDLARSLVQEGYSITKLKSSNIDFLLELGIPETDALNLLQERRPPIPENIVVELLHESRMV
jgi:hypothetical protein